MQHGLLLLLLEDLDDLLDEQILLEDPSGNPVELFEPTRPEARMSPS